MRYGIEEELVERGIVRRPGSMSEAIFCVVAIFALVALLLVACKDAGAAEPKYVWQEGDLVVESDVPPADIGRVAKILPMDILLRDIAALKAQQLELVEEVTRLREDVDRLKGVPGDGPLRK